MKRSDIINKLSKELSILLQREDEFELIRQFITAAMVAEIEKTGNGIKPIIIQAIDPKTGTVISEFWGVNEVSEFLGKKINAIRSDISNCVNGKKHIAYGYIWKKI